MKIIVDTNIVISALINDKGKIGQLLLNKPGEIQFLSPIFLLREIDAHSNKIRKITGYSEDELLFVKNIITESILFVDERTISASVWQYAYDQLINIDEKDTSFLALAMETNGTLWTGDKKLINGLANKNINKTVTTDMLYLKYFQL